LLSALDEETLVGDMYHEFPAHRGHAHEVAPGGAILYDGEQKKFIEWIERDDIYFWEMPYVELLEKALDEAGKPGQARAYRIMTNTLALGASAGALGFDFEAVGQAIRESFGMKAGKVAELNVSAARLAYEYAREHFGGQLKFRLPPAFAEASVGRPAFAEASAGRPAGARQEQILVKGTQAVGLAKLKAGCGLQTYYPISPATDESVYLENYQGKYNLVVLQTEDEVAAIDAAVMGAHGGVRSSTSTSGPGFELMPEGLGFAAITEAPGPVVVVYQRGGPSTGMPTRHEQGDLQFTLRAGQGEIPRIVIAPGDIEECFFDTFDAFNYADRYQVPVVVLVDKHLASSYQTLPPFDTSQLRIDRGLIFDPKLDGNGDYLRNRFTESGLSPRALPGQPDGIFWTTTDEHDQRGHITEGIGNRLEMMQKRMNKMKLAAREIAAGKKFRLFGPPGSGEAKTPVLILSWGSTKGAILDALQRLDPQYQNYRFLQFRMLEPFPAEAAGELLSTAALTISFECNYSGQLASLIREQTGQSVHQRVVKYDGRPFSEDEIVTALENAVSGGPEKIIISEGKVVGPEYGLEQVNELVELRRKRGKMSAPVVPVPPGYNR
jgi:2-oxoglutarate ferredoxin oxidoreductase subunit alpha